VKPFELSLNQGVFSGRGSVSRLSALIGQPGSRVVLVHGSGAVGRSQDMDAVIRELESRYDVFHAAVSGEPEADFVDETVSLIKARGGADSVAAIGGGSVIDTAKALSYMIINDGMINDYLEGIQTAPVTGNRLPLFAVPTTAGTGSEATRNAVITVSGKNPVKRSLRHERLVPDAAILDPGLLATCPPQVIAASGLDAITQLIEAYLSTEATDFTDSLALSGLRAGLPALEAWYTGSDPDAAAQVQYAAWLSGVTLAHAGLGVVHGFAGWLGARYSIPHGIVCGRLLGTSLAVISGKTDRMDPAHAKLDVLAGIMKADGGSDIGPALTRLADRLGIPKLGTFGLSVPALPEDAAKCTNKFSPGNLTLNDRISILERSL